MNNFMFSCRGGAGLKQSTAIKFYPGLKGGPETGEKLRALQRVAGLKLFDLVGGEEATSDGEFVAVGPDPFTVDTHGMSLAYGNQSQIAAGGEVEFHGTRHAGFTLGPQGEDDSLRWLLQIPGKNQPQPAMGFDVGVAMMVQPEAAGALLLAGGEQRPQPDTGFNLLGGVIVITPSLNFPLAAVD